MISAKCLTKSAGGKTVLNGINCAISPGKITVLIGPSGAGKSSLLRILSLIDEPDSGEISIDGTFFRSGTINPSFAAFSPWPMVTVVFQQLFLWPHLTLRQNIRLPSADRLKSNSKNAELDFQQLIDSLGLAECIDRYPNETSLGERQRTALARAILLKPRYLLLDEITSSLDIEQIAVVLNLLPQLKEQEIGILLVTHLLEFAKRSADEVLFLDDGRLVESGGVNILESAQTERLQKFISCVESAK